MGWWVKDHIAVNEDETKQLCSIEVDTAADLPAADQSATAGFIIVRGSDSKDVATGDKYIMDSTGAWKLQPSGVQLDLTGYATTQDLTDGLAGKVDTSAYTAGQAAQETEIGVVSAQGAKNMLKPNNAAGHTLTTHGRTFELLADGGIKITGDNPDSSYADFYVSGTWGSRDPIINETEDNCILSFDCAVALQTQNLYIRAVDRRTGSTARAATAKLNQESRFAFPITTVLITVQPDVVLPSGGVTVYPMIRRGEITDSTYVPYAPTNRELYETKTEQKETNAIANLGAKNLLTFNGYGTGAENGVTYVINSDGTITVNGTPQGTSPSYIELKLNGNAANIARFCDGHHILSGCPAGGGDNKYRMYAARGGYSRFDYGDGVLLTETALTDVRLVIYIVNGYTANNLVFKPMIRSAEITDSTYAPYAPTNRELYEMILALQ